MKNRKNYLKSRKKQLKWKELGSYLNIKCPICGQKTVLLLYEYDANCCTSCNEWLDDVCTDPNCIFCSQRPQTPYEAYYMADTTYNEKNWRIENYQHKTDGMKRHKKIF